MAGKRHIDDISDYADEIVKAIPKGVLLTSKAGEKVNSMTIAWGTLGTNWGRPVFVAYVRKHRSTVTLLDENPEFTINVPAIADAGAAAGASGENRAARTREAARKALGICGSMRGDEVDKVVLAGLTLVDSDVVSVPGIAELPLTLECKVVYRQEQELALYPPEIHASYYPQDVDGRATGSNKDEHIMYFGEIVNAYLIEA